MTGRRFLHESGRAVMPVSGRFRLVFAGPAAILRDAPAGALQDEARVAVHPVCSGPHPEELAQRASRRVLLRAAAALVAGRGSRRLGGGAGDQTLELERKI